ncbi:MAG: carboxylesterase family protein [Thiohalocapsa sp. PB-PSB1]|jgi:para-nitrobenzyl esterase|nr:MAG: hypothetical protein N838_31890 [Thiohalocapsa sp. PB-PSB1]QQO55998.1 MAG: carboxylesterase family protein [Thiohalocapsa sp. PB-PSB1]
MFRRYPFISFVSIILLLSASFYGHAKPDKSLAESQLIVTTSSGPVVGMRDGGVRVFLGIPYATPPVGELRWRPPQPVKAWSEPLQANELGSACYQPERASEPLNMEMSEDCLTLNVWSGASGSAEKKLPVILWIHGGGFKRGNGGLFVGKHLAEMGHVVVTFNYRLNVFGFLAHSALSAEDDAYPASGTYGLMDQQLVLNWVQENVSAFGGDPENVTLMGESAGGISVCTHLVMPSSFGKFHRAIMQSGPCELDVPLAVGEQSGRKVAAKLGCADAEDRLSCMRSKTPEELLSIGMSFYPVYDGIILPDAQSKLLAQGKFARVPVLLGTNKDEHTRQTLYFGDMWDLDDAGYEAQVESTFAGTEIDAEAVMTQYPAAKYKSPGWALSTVLGEWTFSCPVRRNGRVLAKENPIYLYRLTYERPTYMGDVGAFHTEDLEFVFHETKRANLQLKPDEKAFSRKMMGYWSRFAKTGDPNGGDGIAWPQYTSAEDQYMDFADLDSIEVKSGFLPQCDFWDQWFTYY